MIFLIGQEGLLINNFIAIDQFDTNPDVKYCFLSSAHSRHCQSLTNEWQFDGIYCSPITAKVLSVISSRKKRYGISKKWIRTLDLNVWHKMDGFRVMLIDSNHAPGAVMFIIEGEHRNVLGRILYTGFFRADARFYQNVIGLSILQEEKFDVICIDSTYVDFTRNFTGLEFPNRRSSAKEAADLILVLKRKGVESVAIPVPIIGYEGFLVNISRELNCKIWLHPERFEIAHILGINDYFSDIKEDTYIWTCSEIESQQVLCTTNSHIIKASVAPYITSNVSLNSEREHMIQYSDHCSSAELRSFLSLLSFSRIIAIPNELSRLMEDELQNLSLSGAETMHCKEEHGNPEELLFDPCRISWRIGLAFDYAIKKFCDLSTIENLPELSSDENVEEMLSETNHVDNFFIEQHLKMDTSDIANGSDAEMAEDELNEMAVLDVRYKLDNLQIQDSCKSDRTASNISDAKMAIGILEELCDVPVLLDYLTNRFYTEDIDYDSEDKELSKFLSDMDISKAFNDFGDLFEKYQAKSMEAMSIGIMNQPYHVEENICYDASNVRIPWDVMHELLDYNPMLESHQMFSAERYLGKQKLMYIIFNKNNWRSFII